MYRIVDQHDLEHSEQPYGIAVFEDRERQQFVIPFLNSIPFRRFGLRSRGNIDVLIIEMHQWIDNHQQIIRETQEITEVLHRVDVELQNPDSSWAPMPGSSEANLDELFLKAYMRAFADLNQALADSQPKNVPFENPLTWEWLTDGSAPSKFYPDFYILKNRFLPGLVESA